MLEHVCPFVHKKSRQQNTKKVKLICVDGARIKYGITIHVYLNTFLGTIHACMHGTICVHLHIIMLSYTYIMVYAHIICVLTMHIYRSKLLRPVLYK